MAEPDPAAALLENIRVFQEDKKAVEHREHDLAKTVVTLLGNGITPNAVATYRAGWLSGFLYAHGTPTNAYQTIIDVEHGDDDVDDHKDAPRGPEGDFPMGIA